MNRWKMAVLVVYEGIRIRWYITPLRPQLARNDRIFRLWPKKYQKSFRTNSTQARDIRTLLNDTTSRHTFWLIAQKISGVSSPGVPEYGNSANPDNRCEKQKNLRTEILRFYWSGQRDSNPRSQPWQGCALPTKLCPQRIPAVRSKNSVGDIGIEPMTPSV